jgi:NAD+ kinase
MAPMARYRSVGVTVKSSFDGKEEIMKRIFAVLKREKCDIFVDEKRLADVACAGGLRLLSDCGALDLMLVVGGDGTILRSIRETHDLSVPLLSINRGAVGFLAETNIEEIETVLPALLRGEGVIEERSLLDVRVRRGGKEMFAGIALNEAVIAQGAISRLLHVKTSVNGEDLTTYNADGLIIATPTGSTAYSLAAGGPIVHPSMQAMILTPINPHSFSQKPIVVPAASTVEAEVLKKPSTLGDTDVSLTLDGQVYHPLQRNDVVRIAVHPGAVRFVRRAQDTFFSTLRRKLKWGGE